MVRDDDIFPRLIRLAAECKKASDFSRVLEELAHYADADGCTVWEIFHAGTDDRKFFKLAEHFPVQDPDKQSHWYFLPEACVTGRAIRTNTTEVVDDIDTAIVDDTLPSGHLLKARAIKTFCSVPVSFGPMREAAINFYRKEKRSFRGDLRRIENAAGTIPDLNHGILNQMGFGLLQTVEKTLDEGGEVLQRVLESVTEQFNAVESAIYLEDRVRAPGEYELKAHVWPWDFPVKERYVAGEDGITVWAIDHNEPVRFVDLGQFEEEKRTRGYDGMSWTPRVDLLQNAIKQYHRQPFPPLGFVCAPIRDGKRVVGAIHCCMAKANPHSFDERHIAFLGLVADRIGHWWGNQVVLREEKRQENKLAKQFEEQNQIYEDFLHQLRNPLLKASMLAQRAVDPRTQSSVDLRQLRTFVRQVLQFSESLNHFIALSKRESIQATLEVLTYEYVVDALKEMAAEQALIVREDRGLRFQVDEDSFEPFRGKAVFAAMDLLQHCLFNLLDNAAKYSSSDTEITIRGRVQDSSKTLMIAVINRGHRIESGTKKRLIERGYRGDRALRTTAGGRGIGLWIVDQFMKAMGGRLMIVPTDRRGLNEFQLVFRFR